MSGSGDSQPAPSRRRFLATASVLAAGALVDPRRGAAMVAPAPQPSEGTPNGGTPTNGTPTNGTPIDGTPQVESLWGEHQGGILTPAQRHSYFTAFDLTTEKRADVVGVLRDWTAAAARLCAGQTAGALGGDLGQPGADSGDALELPPSRLTITFGIGAGLFTSKDGKDRYGLANRRPAALIDLPVFHGDQLVESQTGGDLSIQACADDAQVAFHAVRQLARLAEGSAQKRWTQIGFLPTPAPGKTPRNLMGFKDGTQNPSTGDSKAMDQFVWAGDEGPGWMRGGSYVVVRRIRMALEHWDRVNIAFQEQTIGRSKYSGAPLGGKDEFDTVNLDAQDQDGNPLIADNAHVRLATAASNEGARILRRPYSYNDGVNFTSERWPPWRQGMEYDAGLFFLCYQRDPRTGFVKIFENMAKVDMLNQFVTHTGGGLFACPGGIAHGEYVGQRLFSV